MTVEPGVQLEVLDWGGTGDVMVLLTGLGDSAHVFDEFAYQFTDRFHVIGITRRGFGRSSQPEQGYDVATRARDDVKVLDQLGIRKAVFMGHSISGDELSQLGAAHPDRVEKLVYLDAAEYGGIFASLAQPPGADFTDAELESLPRFAAASVLKNGYRVPMTDLCNIIRTDASGRVVGTVTPDEIKAKIFAGSQLARFQEIKAPTLGLFVPITPETRMPYYWDLDTAQQEEFVRNITAISEWQAKYFQRFRTIPNSRFVEFRDSNHYLFIRDEATVARAINAFLKDQ